MKIVPAGAQGKQYYRKVNPLKYQQTFLKPSNDLFTVNLRYKKPHEFYEPAHQPQSNTGEIETGYTSENFVLPRR